MPEKQGINKQNQVLHKHYYSCALSYSQTFLMNCLRVFGCISIYIIMSLKLAIRLLCSCFHKLSDRVLTIKSHFLIISRGCQTTNLVFPLVPPLATSDGVEKYSHHDSNLAAPKCEDLRTPRCIDFPIHLPPSSIDLCNSAWTLMFSCAHTHEHTRVVRMFFKQFAFFLMPNSWGLCACSH